jgi:hypothetical protein
MRSVGIYTQEWPPRVSHPYERSTRMGPVKCMRVFLPRSFHPCRGWLALAATALAQQLRGKRGLEFTSVQAALVFNDLNTVLEYYHGTR